MDHRVEKVIALMKEHLHRGWSAGRLAQFVNISPSRLHQLFKDETGLPPARYLRLLRMERARELLETTYLSVKEVIVRVGLMDESHFVRDFKRSYGSTPARYRERFRQGLPQEDAHHDGHPSHQGPGALPQTTAWRHPPQAHSLSPTAPPLLLRRASHPRHLAGDASPLLRAKQKRELLSLMYLRHLAFADLTDRITCNLVRAASKERSIFYRPRRSSLSRRLPPAARRRAP